MKIYNISNENSASQIKQLIRLNSECIRLQWSKTIKDVPDDVLDSLENIEDFIKERVEMLCKDSSFQYELSMQEEKNLTRIIKDNPDLRDSIGTGVIVNGIQSETVLKELQQKNNCPKAILESLSRDGNTIIF